MADLPPTTRVTRGTVARQAQEESAHNRYGHSFFIEISWRFFCSFGGDEQMEHSGMGDPNLDSSYSSNNSGANVFRAPAGRGRKRRSAEDNVDLPVGQPVRCSRSFAQSPILVQAKRGRGGRGGGGRGRGRRAASSVGVGLDDVADESSLFSMVKSGNKKLSVRFSNLFEVNFCLKTPIWKRVFVVFWDCHQSFLQVVIDEWIEEYERHPDSALVQLQQLFISASGCKGVISSNMIQHMEYR
jgi:hypothetical protein